ncbi:hypothetical protein ADL22_23265 [Streptomyces sp. NRRL F-4489]|uniref:hypothetical protein n=1 Tax=Streptomyces sp. NRRL F-4489 TaxID=1609095 RepID=UPI00074854F4|nr:hypothetical protein [Streptomyces sp. NRRL F-4489]KUL36828.1 hypothetical protein ADL22_23265 [Streptomyces sp. NRRL F-4489]
MAEKPEAWRTAVHLAGVGFVGCALSAAQFWIVLTALLTGKVLVAVVVCTLVAAIMVSLLAGFAGMARPFAPLTRRARGRWAWAGGVYAFGTVGVIAAIAAEPGLDGLSRSNLLFPWGGACCALAAGFFLPGARTRWAALGLTVALAAGLGYHAWSAAQPPTLNEWLTANRVDRALLRVGEPPTGYTLRVNGAGGHAFGAEYVRPGASAIHLSVEQPGRNARRTDARGCPVPFGETIECADDGSGRQLITYKGTYPRQELRLRQAGLIYTLTLEGRRTDLGAARHILSTLRPATDSELAQLVTLPMSH